MQMSLIASASVSHAVKKRTGMMKKQESLKQLIFQVDFFFSLALSFLSVYQTYKEIDCRRRRSSKLSTQSVQLRYCKKNSITIQLGVF